MAINYWKRHPILSIVSSFLRSTLGCIWFGWTSVSSWDPNLDCVSLKSCGKTKQIAVKAAPDKSLSGIRARVFEILTDPGKVNPHPRQYRFPSSKNLFARAMACQRLVGVHANRIQQVTHNTGTHTHKPTHLAERPLDQTNWERGSPAGRLWNKVAPSAETARCGHLNP